PLGGGRAEEAGNPAIAFCHSEHSRGISKYFWRMVSDVSIQLDTRGVQLDEKRLVHCGDGSSASCTILQTIWHSAGTHPCHSDCSRGISNYLLYHGTITSGSTSLQMSMTGCSTL